MLMNFGRGQQKMMAQLRSSGTFYRDPLKAFLEEPTSGCAMMNAVASLATRAIERETVMSDSEELMQDQDRIEAYRQLKERADNLGYASVNHALDALEELKSK